MTNFSKKQFLVAAMFAVLAVAVTSLMNSRQAVAQNPNPGSAPVNIVAPLPLPVTGSTTVSGTVAISGTPNVKVTNPATDPVIVRDADNPARRPFQTTLCA